MRLRSVKKVVVRKKIIGGEDMLVCLPLVAGNIGQLIHQVKELLPLNPDLLEWRIDGFDTVKDLDKSLAALKELRSCVGNIPLIYTCRSHKEGGLKTIPQKTRLNLITASILSGHIDLADIEMCNDKPFIKSIIDAAQETNTGLIFSYHNFEETPDEAFIYDKLAQAEEMGADIAKVAVMPKNYGDVLTLLNATLKARENLDLPLVTMSMGPEGAVTRLAGGLFGSDITFAVGQSVSAPGQILVEKLRQAMEILYK